MMQLMTMNRNGSSSKQQWQHIMGESWRVRAATGVGLHDRAARQQQALFWCGQS